MSPFIHKIKFRYACVRTGLKQASAINIQKRTASWLSALMQKKKKTFQLDKGLITSSSSRRGGTKTRLERVSEIQSSRNHPSNILSYSPLDLFVLDVVYTYRKIRWEDRPVVFSLKAPRVRNRDVHLLLCPACVTRPFFSRGFLLRHAQRTKRKRNYS